MTTKKDPSRYDWYTYQGKKLNISTPDADVSLSKGEVFGISRGTRTYVYLVDMDRDHQVRLEDHDAERIINNSKGYTGVIGKTTLKAGVGGLDRPRDEGEVRINSTLFTKGHYNAQKKALSLQFRNGNIWQYADVTPKEVMEFERAKSQGKWYNEYIKATKESRRMQSLSSNAPRYWSEDQLPLEPDVYGEGLLPSGFAIGQRVSWTLGEEANQLNDCIVSGVHFYRGKVAYDLFVPEGFEDYQPTSDSPITQRRVYFHMSNIDSVQVTPNGVTVDAE